MYVFLFLDLIVNNYLFYLYYIIDLFEDPNLCEISTFTWGSTAATHGELYLIHHYMIKFATGRWLSPGALVSSTNKTDCHNVTEVLLKVVLNTITLVLWFYYNWNFLVKFRSDYKWVLFLHSWCMININA